MSSDAAKILTNPGSEPPLKGDNFVSADRPFPTARGMLSKEEIEALLRPDLPDELTDKVPDNISPLSQPRFAAERDPDIEQGLIDVAQTLTSRLTLRLRSACHIDGRFTSSGQSEQRFSDITISTHSAYSLFTDERGDVAAVLGLATPVLKTIAAEGVGGDASSVDRTGPLTVLEAAIIRQLLSPLAESFDSGRQLTLSRIETDPDALLSILPAGRGIEVHLDCIVTGAAGGGLLFVGKDALPEMRGADALQPATPRVSVGVGSLSVTLTARMASLSVPVSRLSNLKPGSTLLLGVPADHCVELLSGGRRGKPVAEGRVGRKGQKMAVRISQTKPIG